MPDFETIFKMLVLGLVALGVPIVGYAAITVVRRMRLGVPDPAGGQSQEVEFLRQRVAELEAQQERVAELEERLDFAERLLLQAREERRLAQGPGESR